MKKMKSLLLMALALLPASKTLAQTNAQVFYDFGSDRKFVTLTLEMFKQDKWGNTYFFVDHDFNYDKMDSSSPNVAQGGTYTEISRALNFWQNTKMKNWNLHVEYNGYHQELPYQQRMALRCGVFHARQEFQEHLDTPGTLQDYPQDRPECANAVYRSLGMQGHLWIKGFEL